MIFGVVTIVTETQITSSPENGLCEFTGCKCSKRKATCIEFMSYIPEMPSSITQVVFENSNFSFIDAYLLSNISSNVVKLTFTNTSTVEIRHDAFTKLNKLEELKIASNHLLRPVNISLESLPNRMKTIKFSKIVYMMNIPTGLFQSKRDFSLTNLIINTCNLSKIDLRIFGNVSLKTLDLTHNKLKLFKTENNTIRKLKTVILSYNYFSAIPIKNLLNPKICGMVQGTQDIKFK